MGITICKSNIPQVVVMAAAIMFRIAKVTVMWMTCHRFNRHIIAIVHRHRNKNRHLHHRIVIISNRIEHGAHNVVSHTMRNVTIQVSIWCSLCSLLYVVLLRFIISLFFRSDFHFVHSHYPNALFRNGQRDRRKSGSVFETVFFSFSLNRKRDMCAARCAIVRAHLLG